VLSVICSPVISVVPIRWWMVCRCSLQARQFIGRYHSTALVICLQWGAKICTWCSWCHCHPIISCVIKIQNGSTLPLLAYTCC